MGLSWIYISIILAINVRNGHSSTCASRQMSMSAKEKVYRSPIVVLAEFMGNIQLDGFANYSDDPRHDPWGLLDYGNRHKMKILCTFKLYGVPVLDTDMILVDSPDPCSDPSYTAGWQVGDKLLLPLIWRAGKYQHRYNIYGYGPPAYPYTTDLIQTVLTVCGMRQFYLPPGSQGNNSVTCPILPTDPCDCTIPRLTRDPYLHRMDDVPPPQFNATEQCPGISKVILRLYLSKGRELFVHLSVCPSIHKIRSRKCTQ